jgi:hypothetical protein
MRSVLQRICPGFIVRLKEDFLKNATHGEIVILRPSLKRCPLVMEMERYYKNTDQVFSGEASWKVFADALAAARVL